MSPTTFKPTLTTQSKDHISDKDNNEKTSILHKPKVDTISSPGQDKDRDARAYEHERKRTKHAAEWAKRRVRKMIGRPTGARAPNVGRQAKGGKAGLDSEVDDGYAVTLQGRDTEHSTAKISDGLGAGLLTKVFLPPSDDGRTDTFKADSGVKINLSEIMISQRKPRKPNAGDFEVIPHVRSVIALDDVANVHDMEDLDEPWEHIYVNNGEGKVSDGVNKFGRLTYARVAGTGCQ